MRIRWSQRARDDLISIGRYIAADNPRAARRWTGRLKARISGVARNPQAGRVVPEFARSDVREVTEGNYRLVYQVRGKALEVLTVFEGHRTLRANPPPPAGPRP